MTPAADPVAGYAGFAAALREAGVACDARRVQAYLAAMVVAAGPGRRGLGRRLVDAAFAACGAERLDLLSTADPFYESFVHARWSGFRIYPDRPNP